MLSLEQGIIIVICHCISERGSGGTGDLEGWIEELNRHSAGVGALVFDLGGGEAVKGGHVKRGRAGEKRETE